MKFFRTLFFFALMLSGMAAFGMNVKTDYDRSFEFRKLRTFSFEEQNRPAGRISSLEDKRIRDAIRSDLEARGFRYQPDGPADFMVAYYAREREKAEVEPLGYTMPLRWRWGWGPRVWARYYTEGSLVVDLIDPGNNQLFWRGRVTDTVKGLEQSEKQIDKGTDQLVKRFVKDSKRS